MDLCVYIYIYRYLIPSLSINKRKNAPHQSSNTLGKNIMAEENKLKRWEGKATVEVRGTGEEIAWQVLEDFCNLHKWLPIDTCYKLEGIEGQPGLIRYCASTKKGVDENSEPVVKFVL